MSVGAGTGVQRVVPQGLLPSSVREQQGLDRSTVGNKREAKCDPSTCRVLKNQGAIPQLLNRTLVTGSLGSPRQEKMNQDQ